MFILIKGYLLLTWDCQNCIQYPLKLSTMYNVMQMNHMHRDQAAYD